MFTKLIIIFFCWSKCQHHLCDISDVLLLKHWSSHFSRCSSFAAANSLFIKTLYNHFFHYSFDNVFIPYLLCIFLSLLFHIAFCLDSYPCWETSLICWLGPSPVPLFCLSSNPLSFPFPAFYSPTLSFPFSAMDNGVVYRPNYDLHYSPNNSMRKGSIGAAHSWENVLCITEELQEHPRKPTKHYKIHLKRHFSAFLSSLIGIAV